MIDPVFTQETNRKQFINVIIFRRGLLIGILTRLSDTDRITVSVCLTLCEGLKKDTETYSQAECATET